MVVVAGRAVVVVLLVEDDVDEGARVLAVVDCGGVSTDVDVELVELVAGVVVEDDVDVGGCVEVVGGEVEVEDVAGLEVDGADVVDTTVLDVVLLDGDTVVVAGVVVVVEVLVLVDVGTPVVVVVFGTVVVTSTTGPVQSAMAPPVVGMSYCVGLPELRLASNE